MKDLDENGVFRLVEFLQPTIQTEVALIVLRLGPESPEGVRSEVESLVRTVWETLFRDHWYVLRHFIPDHEDSPKEFVALVSRSVALGMFQKGPSDVFDKEAPGGTLPTSFNQQRRARSLLKQIHVRFKQGLDS